MSKKLFKTVGKIAGAVVAVAAIGTGIGAALGGTMMLSIFGTSIAASAIAGAASLISVGASLLSKPKATKMSEANNDRLNISLNPRTPRVMAFGRTALATDLRDQEFTGTDKEYLHRFVVVAAHKVDSIQEIWFDDHLAWTSAGGVQSKYAGYLAVTPVLEGTPANAINISSRMGSSRRFTGCAYVYFRYKLTGNSKKTESPFSQQVPTRLTIVGQAIPCYDPRQDSTRGGSGTHRAEDQSTWTWGEHARNPACQLATFMLGWRIQNPQSGTWKLSVGSGTAPDRVDWQSFIDGANLCDEPVALAAGGTEPRYRGDGLTDDDDDPLAVTEAFKAAMNADVDDQDGLIRLTVFHNDLATPDADFDTIDVEDDFQWLQTLSPTESFNTVRGSYIEPDPRSLYQPAPYREVSVAAPGTLERVHPVDFGLVQSKGQAERLAKQRLQRQLYGGTFRATFLAAGWKVQKNSVVRLSFAPEGWTNKLFRVAEIEVREDGLVPMVLREEHPDIYAWDAEESPPVEIAEPTHYEPGQAPIPQFLGTIEEGATSGATVPDTDGTGGNITKPGGEFVEPGLIRNDLLELTPDGLFGFRPLIGSGLQELGRVNIVGLGGAEKSVVDKANAASDRLAEAAIRLAAAESKTRENMRDAGIYVDPDSGEVRISAIEQTDERLSEAEIRVSAAEAEITLRATTTYVDDQIALAVLDPSQVADLENLQIRIGEAEIAIDANAASITSKADLLELTAVEGRVTTAEQEISALEGTVSTKVDSTVVDALETRVTSAEQDISAITGESAGITQVFRAARVLDRETDENAETSLWALLNADKEARTRVAVVAEARQEMTARIISDVAAEATQRIALGVRVSSAEAGIASEQTARADGDAALAQDIQTVATDVDGLSSSVTTLSQSVDGVEAKHGVRLDVNGHITGFVQNNDGEQGDFIILADRFAILSPSGGARTEYSNGHHRVYDSSGGLIVRMGVWT